MKSLSIAYAVRRKAKGLGPYQAPKAEAAPEPVESLPSLEPEQNQVVTPDAAPEAPRASSALDSIMKKHKFFASKAAK